MPIKIEILLNRLPTNKYLIVILILRKTIAIIIVI